VIKIPSKPLPCIAEMHGRDTYVNTERDRQRERERNKPIIIATLFLPATD
jgi:hypothetical protein